MNFAKLQKATVSFVVSLCPSVCPFVQTEQLCSYRTDFHETEVFFKKSVEKIQVSLKPYKNNGYFT